MEIILWRAVPYSHIFFSAEISHSLRSMHLTASYHFKYKDHSCLRVILASLLFGSKCECRTRPPGCCMWEELVSKLFSTFVSCRGNSSWHAWPVTGKGPDHSNVWGDGQRQQCVLPRPRFCALLLCSCTKWWALFSAVVCHYFVSTWNMWIWTLCILMTHLFSTTPFSQLPENISLLWACHFSEWFQLLQAKPFNYFL